MRPDWPMKRLNDASLPYYRVKANFSTFYQNIICLSIALRDVLKVERCNECWFTAEQYTFVYHLVLRFIQDINYRKINSKMPLL
jgi:hypothetical protein